MDARDNLLTGGSEPASGQVPAKHSRERVETFIGQLQNGEPVSVIREGFSTWIVKTARDGAQVYLSPVQARHDAMVLETAANMADLQGGR